MSPPWNNFVRALLRFAMVRSGHGKRTRENHFQISLLHSSVAERRRRRKTPERRSSSIPPIEMLAVVRWVLVLRPFVKCLHMRSSILQNI
jgi:hypothetical protein